MGVRLIPAPFSADSKEEKEINFPDSKLLLSHLVALNLEYPNAFFSFHSQYTLAVCVLDVSSVVINYF